MHISGTFDPKLDIENVKPDIESAEMDIENVKLDIRLIIPITGQGKLECPRKIGQFYSDGHIFLGHF